MKNVQVVARENRPSLTTITQDQADLLIKKGRAEALEYDGDELGKILYKRQPESDYKYGSEKIDLGKGRSITIFSDSVYSR
ncbi:MAG: hypothetical protein ACR2PB_02950 [Desulfocapsaceae bacterium]